MTPTTSSMKVLMMQGPDSTASDTQWFENFNEDYIFKIMVRNWWYGVDQKKLRACKMRFYLK